MIGSILRGNLLLVLCDLTSDANVVKCELEMALELYGPHSPIVEALQHKYDIAIWAVERLSEDLDKVHADEMARLNRQKQIRESQEAESALWLLLLTVGIVLMFFVCAFISASQAGV